MSSTRSLHISCATWDQVEALYERKLRRGNLMSIKVPFAASAGDRLTLSLELPSQLIIVIDGLLTRTAPVDGSDKHWIEVELTGFTSEIATRLREMVRSARAGAPVLLARTSTAEAAAALPLDERRLFIHLSGELRRLRALPVFAVLSVDPDAGASTVRRGWLELVRRYHPDVVAPRRSPAVSHLAEEIVIHANRAYDRCRASLVARGHATARGSTLVAPAGWFIGLDDVAMNTIASEQRDLYVPAEDRRRRRTSAQMEAANQPAAAVVSDASVMTELATKVRSLLAAGRAVEAREALAEVLSSHPRERQLRGLYHLTSAVIAMGQAQPMLAVAQLEAAMAQDDRSGHAEQLLTLLSDGVPDGDQIRSLFQ